jgi:hypothetical protein
LQAISARAARPRPPPTPAGWVRSRCVDRLGCACPTLTVRPHPKRAHRPLLPGRLWRLHELPRWNVRLDHLPDHGCVHGQLPGRSVICRRLCCVAGSCSASSLRPSFRRAGYYCAAGSSSATAAQCPAGASLPVLIARRRRSLLILIVAGTYGNVAGLGTPACRFDRLCVLALDRCLNLFRSCVRSGQCPANFYCPLGTVNANTNPCPVNSQSSMYAICVLSVPCIAANRC